MIEPIACAGVRSAMTSPVEAIAAPRNQRALLPAALAAFCQFSMMHIEDNLTLLRQLGQIAK